MGFPHSFEKLFVHVYEELAVKGDLWEIPGPFL